MFGSVCRREGGFGVLSSVCRSEGGFGVIGVGGREGLV